MPALRSALSDVGDAISDRLTHAFDGRDLTAMHDRAVAYLAPSVSMPSLRDVSRGVDRVTDRLQESWTSKGKRRQVRRRRSFGLDNAVDRARTPGSAFTSSSIASEEGEELGANQFTFAYTMSARAIHALNTQGICTEHQIAPTHAAPSWRKRLDSGLELLFLFQQDEYGADALFDMTPIWTPDAEVKVWRLQLDTGLVDVIVGEDGEACREASICLDVDFALNEGQGSVKIEDMKRGVVGDDGEWMAVKE